MKQYNIVVRRVFFGALCWVVLVNNAMSKPKPQDLIDVLRGSPYVVRVLVTSASEGPEGCYRHSLRVTERIKGALPDNVLVAPVPLRVGSEYLVFQPFPSVIFSENCSNLVEKGVDWATGNILTPGALEILNTEIYPSGEEWLVIRHNTYTIQKYVTSRYVRVEATEFESESTALIDMFLLISLPPVIELIRE